MKHTAAAAAAFAEYCTLNNNNIRYQHRRRHRRRLSSVMNIIFLLYKFAIFVFNYYSNFAYPIARCTIQIDFKIVSSMLHYHHHHFR